jgi:hypothetical protein
MLSRMSEVASGSDWMVTILERIHGLEVFSAHLYDAQACWRIQAKATRIGEQNLTGSDLMSFEVDSTCRCTITPVVFVRMRQEAGGLLISVGPFARKTAGSSSPYEQPLALYRVS